MRGHSALLAVLNFSGFVFFFLSTQGPLGLDGKPVSSGGGVANTDKHPVLYHDRKSAESGLCLLQGYPGPKGNQVLHTLHII